MIKKKGHTRNIITQPYLWNKYINMYFALLMELQQLIFLESQRQYPAVKYYL